MLDVFVADADTDHIAKTRQILSRHPKLNFAGGVTHGGAAFRRMLSSPVDVLIMDLQLPGMDGIALLRALSRLKNPPLSIVCTRFYSELAVNCATQSGAAYILYKPVEYANLPNVIIECYRFKRHHPQSIPDSAQQNADADMLTRLGFVPSLNGTCYLRVALRLIQENPDLMRNLSRGLYPAIAKAFNTSPARVERDLRNAIDIAYSRGGLGGLFSRRPSNSTLLAYLVDKGIMV